MEIMIAPPPTHRAVTIHDVAAHLGMHKSTVSLALSGKGNVSKATRARVAEVATALGYEPNPLAQRLANGVNNSLVCLCSSGLDVGLTTEKILLIQRELAKLSLEVPIYTFAEWSGDTMLSQAAQIRQLCRQHPRAIVWSAQALTPVVFEELRQYQANGGIVVSYDLAVPLDCDQVVFDRQDNAYQGAKYLLDHGHRKVGIGISVGGGWPSNDESLPQNLRVLGFERALKEAGLNPRPEWVFQHSTYEAGGAELAKHYLASEDRPTGLCIVNHYVSLAFMVELSKHGVSIPKELSIVGHDNQPVANYCPVPLTSISHPAHKITLAVVELLVDRLNGSTRPPQKVVIRGDLIERQSVSHPC